MEDQSYHKGLNTGVSDGTLSGDRGVQENYRRKANVQHEANKLGENLSRGVAALFLHPVFCFAGFWLIGFGSLLALAPQIGIGNNLDDVPTWYGWTAAAVPIVAAYMLRKIVPRLMAVAFYAGLAVLAVLLVIKVGDIRKERASRADTPHPVVAPAARTTAPRTPSAAEIQQLLIEAASPEITSTPPSEGPENEIGNAYCEELPDFCP